MKLLCSQVRSHSASQEEEFKPPSRNLFTTADSVSHHLPVTLSQTAPSASPQPGWQTHLPGNHREPLHRFQSSPPHKYCLFLLQKTGRADEKEPESSHIDLVSAILHPAVSLGVNHIQTLSIGRAVPWLEAIYDLPPLLQERGKVLMLHVPLPRKRLDTTPASPLTISSTSKAAAETSTAVHAVCLCAWRKTTLHYSCPGDTTKSGLMSTGHLSKRLN